MLVAAPSSRGGFPRASIRRPEETPQRSEEALKIRRLPASGGEPARPRGAAAAMSGGRRGERLLVHVHVRVDPLHVVVLLEGP
jgi:hypothetical protein